MFCCSSWAKHGQKHKPLLLLRDLSWFSQWRELNSLKSSPRQRFWISHSWRFGWLLSFGTVNGVIAGIHAGSSISAREALTVFTMAEWCFTKSWSSSSIWHLLCCFAEVKVFWLLHHLRAHWLQLSSSSAKIEGFNAFLRECSDLTLSIEIDLSVDTFMMSPMRLTC